MSGCAEPAALQDESSKLRFSSCLHVLRLLGGRTCLTSDKTTSFIPCRRSCWCGSLGFVGSWESKQRKWGPSTTRSGFNSTQTLTSTDAGPKCPSAARPRREERSSIAWQAVKDHSRLVSRIGEKDFSARGPFQPQWRYACIGGKR